MQQPGPTRDLVAALEATPLVHGQGGERFSGYVVLGVRFASGDVLALRRFSASSVGAGYTSVWHRDPGGAWVMYQTVPADAGCGRYFSEGVDRVVVADVRITWGSADRFVVSIDTGQGLEWEVSLEATFATRVVSLIAKRASIAAARSALAARIAGSTAGHVLGTGPISLAGETPNGFRFAASPTEVRFVSASRAVFGRRQAGPAITSTSKIQLGDVQIPHRGLFALADAVLRDPMAGRRR